MSFSSLGGSLKLPVLAPCPGMVTSIVRALAFKHLGHEHLVHDYVDRRHPNSNVDANFGSYGVGRCLRPFPSTPPLTLPPLMPYSLEPIDVGF